MTERFGALGPHLASGGWDIIPIKKGEKRPFVAAWQKGFTETQIKEFAGNGYADGNVGLLAKNFPGVDIDVSDEDCAKALEDFTTRLLGAAPLRIGSYPKRLLMYRTFEPFTKLKVFFKDADGSPVDANGKEYALEILGDGQQYLIYGKHPDGHDYVWPHENGPAHCEAWDLTTVTLAKVQDLMSRIAEALPLGWSVHKKTEGSTALVSSDEAFLMSLKAPLEGWTADAVREKISPYIDLDMHYDEWIKVGQAIHHQFGGSDEGFEIWDEMFQEGSKYNGSDYGRARWDSFKTVRPVGQGPITLASVIKMTGAKRDTAQVDKRALLMKAAKDAIGQVTVPQDLQDKVAKNIKKHLIFTEMDRAELEQAIQKRSLELGVRVRITEIRRWITPVAARGAVGEVSEAPDWLKGWVLRNDTGTFMNINTKLERTQMGFRAEFSSIMPIDENGYQAHANQVAIDSGVLDVVDHALYMPNEGELFTYKGKKYANLFDPKSIPEADPVVTPESTAAVEKVLDHLAMSFPDQREREIMISVIAHIVQNPGKRIRWAPYIGGAPGAGKSFLGDLLKAVLGSQNVKPLNGTTLKSDFNEWAVGAIVCVIEEIKMAGHSREEQANKIKTMITNDEIDVHPKGRPAYPAKNTMSYILLSNSLDGIPINESDRRYMMLQSSIEAKQAALLSESGYFDELYHAVNTQAGALRQFFLDYQLHPEFNADGRAPITELRSSVVEASKTEYEHLIADVFERGALGVTENVISSSHFVKALDTEDKISTSAVNKLILNLGFRQLKQADSGNRRTVKWNGKTCAVWVRSGFEHLDPIQELNKSIIPDFLL